MFKFHGVQGEEIMPKCPAVHTTVLIQVVGLDEVGIVGLFCNLITTQTNESNHQKDDPRLERSYG